MNMMLSTKQEGCHLLGQRLIAAASQENTPGNIHISARLAG
jgi:hypothetical protein